MQQYKVSEEVSKTEWEAILQNSRFSSPFQTFKYYNFLKETDNIDGCVSGLFVNKKLKGLIVMTIFKETGIKGFFSRRGVVFGGPLLDDSITNEELVLFLKETSKKFQKETIFTEIRNFFDYSKYHGAFLLAGWRYEPHLNFQLSLHSVEKEKITSLFKYNRKREIKQSIAQGAIYKLCENDYEIEEIYNILNDLYRKRVKVPLPHKDFFLQLHNRNIMKAFIVKHGNETIGGSFCPSLENKGIYTFYYCGIRDYHKKIFPTHLAVLAAMEYAVDNKIPTMDFMGAGKPDIDYGVRKYKSEFGGELVEHGRYFKVYNPFLFKLGVIGFQILKKK